jgi:hypothetical protein
MTCSELAHSFLFANGKRKKEQILTKSQKKIECFDACGFMMSQTIKWDYPAKVLAVVL